MTTKPNPLHKLTNYLVLGFLLYAIYASYGKPSTSDMPALPAEVARLYEPIEAKPSQAETSKWSKVVDLVGQSIRPRMDVISEQAGGGDSPICGQTIVYDAVDTVIGETTPVAETKHRSVRFGVDSMPEGHRRALLTMKSGGKKTIEYPSLWGYTDFGPEAARAKNLRSALVLHSVSPAIPTSAMPFRVYVNPPKTDADLFRCGATISVRMTIWSPEGRRLFPETEGEPSPLSIHIGQAEVPFGIELGLQTLSQGDKASFIVPPEFLTFFNAPKAKSALRERFKSIKFPAGQSIIVDLAVVDAIETPANNTPPDSGVAPTQSAPPKQQKP